MTQTDKIIQLIAEIEEWLNITYHKPTLTDNYDKIMMKGRIYQAEQILPRLKAIIATEKPERFKMPEPDQIINMAILFNDGKLEKEKLSDMVAMADLIIDRLYENGDILIPSSKEDTTPSTGNVESE